MNDKDLNNFLCLADHLHFGQAAKELHMSASALTRCIQKIEEELKTSLFIRQQKKISLTHAGTLFHQYAIKSLKDKEHFLKKITPETNELSGEVKIFCSVTACLSLIPEVLQYFQEQFPNIHINLQTGDAAEALERLRKHHVDFAIAALPDELESSIRTFSMTTTPLVFIKPKQHSKLEHILSKKKKDWSEIPFILPEKGLARKRLDQCFLENNISPNIYSQVSGNEALLAMVHLGCGVGIVPGLVLEHSPLKHQVEVVDLGLKLQEYQIALCTLNSHLEDHIFKTFWENFRQKNS